MKYILTVMLMLISTMSFGTTVNTQDVELGPNRPEPTFHFNYDSTRWTDIDITPNRVWVLSNGIEFIRVTSPNSEGVVQVTGFIDSSHLDREVTTSMRTEESHDQVELDGETLERTRTETTEVYEILEGIESVVREQQMYRVVVQGPQTPELDGEIISVTIDPETGDVTSVEREIMDRDGDGREDHEDFAPDDHTIQDEPQSVHQKNYGGKANELINELRTAGIGGEWDISVDLSDHLNVSTSGRYEDGEGIMGSRIVFTYKILEF